MTLTDIEKLTEKLAEARAELSTIIDRLQLRQGAIMQDALPGIRKAVSRAGAHNAALFTSIDVNRGLFEKPRTQEFHGIKVGLRKGAGGITWEDDAAVVSRIVRQFPPAQADLLIKTTRKPIKSALNDLDVAELKKLGCHIESADDQVMIKPVDGAVDKIVNALLKSAVDEAKKEAA